MATVKSACIVFKLQQSSYMHACTGDSWFDLVANQRALPVFIVKFNSLLTLPGS